MARLSDIEREHRKQALVSLRQLCADQVPMNWLDPLLTGDDAPKGLLTNPDVEKLLRSIRERILNLEM